MMFRYFIYAIATAAITFVYALRLAFHSTILCQYDQNNTEHYLADPVLRGWQFSSVSIGLVLGLIPLPLLHVLGTRNVITIYGIIGCVSCFLYPLSDSMGFWPAFIIRTIQGMPGAMLLWTVNNVSMEWAPKTETAKAIAILTCVYQLSPTIAMVTSGEMCTRWGWEYTYYVLGVITTVVFALFFFFYSNSPYKNRFTSHKEADHIVEGKSTSTKHRQQVPYSVVLRDVQVWLVWYMYFTFFTGTYVFLQYGPTYINQVLNFNVKSTGYWAAAPHFISLFLKFIYGSMLDKCCGFGQKWRMILCYSIVEAICAVCLATLIFTNSPTIALIVYTVFNSLHGLVIVVIMKQIQIVARQHAHFLANGNTMIVALCIFATPSAINLFVPDNSPEQWALLFAGIAVMIVSSVVFFSFFSTSKARRWTEVELIPRDAIQLR